MRSLRLPFVAVVSVSLLSLIALPAHAIGLLAPEIARNLERARSPADIAAAIRSSPGYAQQILDDAAALGIASRAHVLQELRSSAACSASPRRGRPSCPAQLPPSLMRLLADTARSGASRGEGGARSSLPPHDRPNGHARASERAAADLPDLPDPASDKASPN